MQRPTWIIIIAMLALPGLASAHGGGHTSDPPPPPAPPPPPPPAPPPNSGVPPGLRPPSDPPAPAPPETPPQPDPPITPAPQPGPPAPAPKPHDADGPSTPAPVPQPGAAPAPKTGRPKRRGARSGRPASASSWRTWWEFNREHLLGLRRLIRESGTVTTGADARTSLLDAARPRIRRALRVTAQSASTDPQIRGASLIALGRVGTDEEVEVFLSILRPARGDAHVQSMAALGLGLLPAVEDPALRQRIREHLSFIAAAKARPVRVRGFAFIAAGLRARTDRGMAMELARQCTPLFVKDSYDASSLAFACGISRDALLLPELMAASRKSVLGGKKLDDIGRAHAAAALGLIRSPLAFDSLVKLLRSRRAGIHTRRAAALGLGRLLREAELDEAQLALAEKTLVTAHDKARDAELRAYCLIAMAGARRPIAVDRIRDALERSGDPAVKPYAALALGLASRKLVAHERNKVRQLLLAKRARTKEVEFASALTLAVGLAGAAEATDDLVATLGSRRKPDAVRGAAAEALGLLGTPTPAVVNALMAAFREDSPRLLEGTTLALGLLGRRGLAKELVERLRTTSSGPMQGRLTLALAHLGQGTAVDPLLELLRDRTQRDVVRELAAVALGLLADPKDHDVLFELEAYYNYGATTVVTHELLSIF